MQLLESLSPLSSLSTCAFSFSSLWNWLCTSSLCWCCSDRKTHPPSAALSLSLPDSHWLPVRGDITLLLCLPPSSSVPSLSLSLFTSVSADSDHSFIIPPPFPVLYLLPLSSSSSLHKYWISCCSYYCSYLQPYSVSIIINVCVLAYSA